MTKDDIIRMAREADEYADDHAPAWTTEINEREILRDQRFAALVAAAEREACAKVVENHALGYAEPVWAFKLIDTIRARGQA